MEQFGTWTDLGRERATDDIARVDDGELREAVFVHTRATDKFLRASPEHPFVVGAKGTGKSLLLFKKKIAARGLPGALVLPEQGQRSYLPSNDFAELVNASYFWQLFDRSGHPDLPKWALLWEWALLRTVLMGWGRAARPEHDALLAKLCDGCTDDDPYHHIFDYLTRALDEDTRPRLRMPQVQDMRNFVRAHAQVYPPTYLFIDNQDDFFSVNPKFWIASAMGCFMAVNDVRTHSNHRVHLLMTLRPEVVMDLSREERFAAHLGDIVHTTWSDHQLIELLEKRIRLLRPEYLRAPREQRPLGALLGSEFLQNGDVCVRNATLESDNGIEVCEQADEYILRHTLRRPRDLITVGNRLLVRLMDAAATADIEGEARLAVNEAGHDIGKAYIAEVKRLWPWSEPSCGIGEFVREYLDINVMSRAEAAAIRTKFEDRTASERIRADPFSVLYCLGLIGYPVTSERKPGQRVQHFEPAGSTDLERRIPDSAQWLLVHPVLYSGTYNIKPLPGLPVGPGLVFCEPRALAPTPSVIDSVEAAESTRCAVAFTWVHISDIHMGAGSVEHRLDCHSVSHALLRDVRELARPCDAVFLTGDLAFSGRRTQFDEIRTWIAQLATELGLGLEQVYVVPGNHDVTRERNAAVAALHDKIRMRAELDTYLTESTSRKLLRRKFAGYLAFRAALYGKSSPRADELEWALRLPLGSSGVALSLVGLNSVWVSDESDGGGNGGSALVPNMLLSRQALDTGLGQLDDRSLALVLSHHPLGWLEEKSRALLEQYSTRVACVHLSGHCHHSQSDQRRRFGQAGRLVSMAAGAGHVGVGERATNKYAWGGLRYQADKGTWEVGAAVREYLAERDAFVSSLGFDTADGFIWAPIEGPTPDLSAPPGPGTCGRGSR